MRSPLEELSSTLEQLHQQLEGGQVHQAAALVSRAVAECAAAQAAGAPLEPAALATAARLEHACSLAAQRVIAQLVRSGREAGTLERAIRAYSEQGAGADV